VKVYCLDIIDEFIWYNRSIHPDRSCLKITIGTNKMVLGGVCQKFNMNPKTIGKVAVSGCSFGGSYARFRHFAFRHPESKPLFTHERGIWYQRSLTAFTMTRLYFIISRLFGQTSESRAYIYENSFGGLANMIFVWEPTLRMSEILSVRHWCMVTIDQCQSWLAN